MIQISQHIKKHFTIWWIPIITNFLAIGIFFIGVLFRRDWIINLSLIVFFMNIIGTIISSIIQIVKDKWYFIIPQLGLVTLLFFYVALVFTYSPPDYYGVHKKIPENIHFSSPLDSIPSKEEFELHDLVLINNFQPGLYIYHTDHIPIEYGYFYIKAFEVNSNDRLSSERMTVESKIIVDNFDEKYREGAFTIYEGDWGDKYGSKIELWYQPFNGEEYLVQERNFIIEGWQR